MFIVEAKPTLLSPGVPLAKKLPAAGQKIAHATCTNRQSASAHQDNMAAPGEPAPPAAPAAPAVQAAPAAAGGRPGGRAPRVTGTTIARPVAMTDDGGAASTAANPFVLLRAVAAGDNIATQRELTNGADVKLRCATLPLRVSLLVVSLCSLLSVCVSQVLEALVSATLTGASACASAAAAATANAACTQ